MLAGCKDLIQYLYIFEGKKWVCAKLFMIRKKFCTIHLMILCSHELLVDEIKLKKNIRAQKYLMCDVGKQLVMP
jgi:hypothetical protein